MGQFGGFNAGANVGLPGAGLSSGNDFLTNVLIGVGILTLVNTVATVAVPFFMDTSEMMEVEEIPPLPVDSRDTIVIVSLVDVDGWTVLQRKKQYGQITEGQRKSARNQEKKL